MTTLYSSGSIKAAAEENTFSVASLIKIDELQTTSAEKSADCGSASLKNLKRHALNLEGSGHPPEKKKCSAGKSLKSSNKVSSEFTKSQHLAIVSDIDIVA